MDHDNEQYTSQPFSRDKRKLALLQNGKDYITPISLDSAGFLGYPRYLGAQLAEHYRRVPGFVRGALGAAATCLSEPGNGNHFTRRAREFLCGSCRSQEETYFGWISYFDRALREQLYSPELRSELADYDSSAFLKDLFKRSGARELLDRINYVDLHSFLPHNLLRYSDRMSMAHGLEIRCPYADHRLIEFLARVPRQWKLRRGQQKYLLRVLASDFLPRSVLRRGKLGLNPPMGVWLRGHLRHLLDEYLSRKLLRERGYFNPRVVEGMIHDHLNGRRDFSLHLWALISFEEWHRQYLDSKPDLIPAQTDLPELQALPA